MVYYNEIDPYAAQWLRNLIAAGLIPAGDVDERNIVDVQPSDLVGYTQCHFFAGIGGWPYALRLAGWPDDRPVWTGSCPCQPFSAAGAGKAADDERHLWPAWFSLIAEFRPAVIFGEQVEAAIGWGWLDAVFADLEQEGYACGAAVLPACGVGAPHIRQRLWFVANADEGRGGRDAGTVSRTQGETERRVRRVADGSQSGSAINELANRDERGRQIFSTAWLHDPRQRWNDIDGCGKSGELGDTSASGLSPCERQELPGAQQFYEGRAIEQSSHTPWSDAEWLSCSDGKARPVEPGTFPLAHGIPGRVGRLRAYGNAIVPQLAAEFIMATMESISCEAQWNGLR